MRIALRNFKGGFDPPSGLQVYIHGLVDNHWLEVGVEYPNLVVEDSTRVNIALPTPESPLDVLKDLQAEMRGRVGGRTPPPSYLHTILPEAGEYLRKYLPAQVLAYPTRARVNTLYTLWVGSLHRIFNKILRGALSVNLADVSDGDIDLTSITTNASKRRKEATVLGLTQGKVVKGYARHTLHNTGDVTTEDFVERIAGLMKNVMHSSASPLLESVNSHLPGDALLDGEAKEKLSPDLSVLTSDVPTTMGSVWYWGTSNQWVHRLLSGVEKLPKWVRRGVTVGVLLLLRRQGGLFLRREKQHPVTLTRVINVNVWSRVYSIDRGAFIPLPAGVEGLPALTALYARVLGWADSVPAEAIRAMYPVLLGYGAELPPLTPGASAELTAFLDGEIDDLSPPLQAGMLEWIRSHMLGEFIDAVALQEEEVW